MDTKAFKELLIHLDFKGAPPTFSYLKSFIEFLGMKYTKLVTGIVFEFEDTFPYDGNLRPLRGINYYSKEQLREIV